MKHARFLVLAAFVALAGCDTTITDPDVVILSHDLTRSGDGSAVTFAFAADNLTVGQSKVLRCGCTVDLDPWLSSNGFTRADIVDATVTSAKLRVNFPVSENVDFLGDAVVRFEASGRQPMDVASRSSFPAAREATLSPLAGRSVAGFASSDEFSPVLVIEPADLMAGEDYQLTLEIKLRVELQGF